MFKKFLSIILSLLLMGSYTTIIFGDDDCANNNDPSVCNNNSQSSACKAYTACLVSQSESLQQQIKDIEAKREEIAANIDEYTAQIANYNQEINELSVQITELNTQISVLESQIEETQAKIDDTQAQIDEMIDAIKARMIASQSSMRLSPYFDFLMGSSNFEDLLRRSAVLKAVSNSENEQKVVLDNLINQLNEDKEKLEAQKAEVDAKKQEVVTAQNDLVYKRELAKAVEEELKKQDADLEAQGNQMAADIVSIREKINEIGADPGASPGWIYPLAGGELGNGTWAYSSGGTHLGADYVASLGTSVYAIGNGIVLNTANGCEYGNLGNGCGNAYGGTWGGGNQVYMVINVNGQLYGVKYLHLLKDSIRVSAGDGVDQGQVIAQVGSSGNSSGPHCHIEITKLNFSGSAKQYAQQWDGSLTFDAGWGLGSRCEVKGAPCRIRPETVLGG